MSSYRRRNVVSYRTRGSLAYAPAYNGPAPGEQSAPRPKTKRQRRVRSLTRAQVAVRPHGQVAVMTVLGMLAVAVMAALLLVGNARYIALTDETVKLRGELGQLESENATLSAEYERVFDLTRIQTAVGGTMQRPAPGQVEYIDLSEPDSVEILRSSRSTPGLRGLLEGAVELAAELVEYFR